MHQLPLPEMDDDASIERFDGRWFFLSNFAPSPLSWQGETWPTVEHAFQGAKTLDAAERTRVRLADTPGQAKRLGRRVALRPGWDQMREQVMLELLRAKFAPGSELAARLLATGDVRLVEGNHWGDRYWGVCDGRGRNRLGALLMQVRNELASG